jgi:hypothetical protein
MVDGALGLTAAKTIGVLSPVASGGGGVPGSFVKIDAAENLVPNRAGHAQKPTVFRPPTDFRLAGGPFDGHGPRIALEKPLEP